MEKKTTQQLTNVPETMLITLWAKAEETLRPDGLIRDEKAVEAIQQIDYDFSKFKSAKFSQVGCCVRARLIDDEIMEFLERHPDAVVIQLGAGLDARYDRLHRPEVSHWYDLDLPEAIDLRRALLPESERNSYMATSLFDYEWVEQIKHHQKPVLIVIEGVLMYFAPHEVRAFFEELCERLDDATILFDMLAYGLVGRSQQHDSLRKMGGKVQFQWSLLNTQEMETWHPKLHVGKEYYMSQHYGGRCPQPFRFLYKIPYFFRHYNQRVVRIEISKADCNKCG